MNQTTTATPEFFHALTLALNSAVSVARAQNAVNAEKQDAASPEGSVAARHLETLTAQHNILRNDLHLPSPTVDLDDMFYELDKAVSRGDVNTTECIRDRELAKHSPEVIRVRDVDKLIKGLEAQINLLRTKMGELEKERAQNAVTAVWSGITKEQIADATDRDVAAVAEWLRGV